MSFIKLQSNVAGTGIITLTSLNTNTDSTLTLPNQTGTLIASDPAGNVIVTGTLTTTGISDSGNLTFTGTSNRITGDFSNATFQNRVLFQTSTADSGTSISAIPNGNPGVEQSNWAVFGSSDINNSSYVLMSINSTQSQIASGKTGTGTILPLTFYVGENDRMRIDSSGNVGIGTNSPGNRLMVSSPLTGTTPRSNTVLRVQSEATGRDVNIQLSDLVTNSAELGMVSGDMYFATAGTERMRIASSGNVGIGTLLPKGKLQVAAGATGISSGYFGASTLIAEAPLATPGQAFITFGNTVGGTYNYGAATINYATQTTTGGGYGDLIFSTRSVTTDTAPTDRMRINYTGNVGISGNPSSKLHVFTTSAAGDGANQGVNISNADNTRQLLLGVNNVALTTWIQGWIPGSGSSNLTLQPTDGSVGIGASTATQLRSQLTVSGPGQLTAALTDAGATTGTIQINSSVNSVGRGGALTFGALIDNNSYTPFAAIKGLLTNGLGNGTGDLAFSTRNVTGDTALTERMRISSGGNVGIRTNNPLTSLDVFGNNTAYDTPMRATTPVAGSWYYGPGINYNVFYVISESNGRGVYVANGTESWTPNISDARLKNKIGDIENALDAILKLKPLKYYFKDQDQTGTPRYGFFAQNVGEAIPDAMLVSPVPNHELGEVYTYSPDIINTHLVKAVQEQQVLIEQHQKLMDNYQTIINNLSLRVKMLESK